MIDRPGGREIARKLEQAGAAHLIQWRHQQAREAAPGVDEQSAAAPTPHRRFLRDAGRYAPITLARAAASLVGVLVFSRIFTATAFGQYSLVTAAIGVVVPLLGEWVAQPVGRFFNEYRPGPEAATFQDAVSHVASRMGTLAVLVASAGALLAWVASGETWPLSLLLGGGAVVVVQSVSVLVSPLLPARFLTTAYRNYTVATGVGGLALGLLLVWLFGRQVAWLAWGTAGVGLLMLPYLLHHAQIRVVVPWARISDGARQVQRRFWQYGAPLTLWYILGHVLYSGDRYVIAAFWGAGAVGVYSINYNLVNRGIGFITVPLATASWPILMRQWADGAQAEARATLARMTETYALAGVGVVGLVASVGQPATTLLLGHAFQAGFVILAPVLAGLVLRTSANLGAKSLEFHEKTRWMVWDSAVAAVVNLGLNLWWVPRYGFVAAAWAALAAFFVYALLIWWQARRLLPWDIPGRLLSFLLPAAGAGWLLAHGAESLPLLARSPWLATVGGALAFAVCYAAGVLAWRALRRRGP